MPAPPPNPGLCQNCAFVKMIASCRGPVYFQCQKSVTHPKFPKYPRLPVVHCGGYLPAGAAPGAPPAVGRPG